MKKKRNKMNYRLFKVIIILFFLSCQTYYKELNDIPIDEKIIYIENFNNYTFEPQVHQEFTDILKSKFHQRNLLKLTNEYNQAKYIVGGKLLLFRREVLLYENELQPASYKVDLVIELKIYKNNQEVLLLQEVYDSIRYSMQGPSYETDLFARRRLFEKIAQKVLYYLEKTIVDDVKTK